MAETSVDHPQQLFLEPAQGAEDRGGGDRTRARSPAPAPEYQKTRGRSNCPCNGPCFYCGDALEGRHDHDHFPIPWRLGGRHTVPSCIRCHRLKDLGSLHKWPPAAVEAAADGMPTRSALALGFVVSRIKEDVLEPVFGDDSHGLILELVDACTNPEARIAVAVMANAGLEHDKRVAEELARGEDTQ